ncbi:MULTISPECIES: kynureninase [unclassified Sphingobium]|uniref:kynureninase n=1 Tax=unclassified Sphingobium TaxID=2611147 RepID=UPI00076FF4DB|nr:MULTISPECIES: kynureninase [unclassified Sphingobium]AMK25440.1 kynureninase [Sphingobium sp. TKS]NML90904.1 kynureninase [Sphingobium sp. TB-6]
MTLDLAEITDLDGRDPLRGFRDEFQLREGLIYVDGNSLGAAPRAAAARIADAVSNQWGEGLITSWLGAQWSTAPRRIGDKIASIVGARPGEIIASDSTSVNIFKALTAAISLRPDRSVILSESTNFPTDVYMMQGIEAFSGGRLRAVTVAPDTVLDRLDEDVAVLLLTQVHYKSGLVRDMAEVTRRAHDKGVLVIWDLSHSAGAIQVDLNGADADFAVGCGYKFLNGGPGAPAFIFVAGRHQSAAPVLSGWFGHASPFTFEEDYRPAEGIARFMCGTPQVLGLTALECGVDLMARADMREIRGKSIRLGQLFIERMELRCAEFGFQLVSPLDPQLRGSQIAYAHPHGYEMVQALKEKDVIGDFRAPDILRFGLTPLYLRYADIVEAVERLRDVCLTRAWDKPEYRERAAVT